jgi:hypothetical protein
MIVSGLGIPDGNVQSAEPCRGKIADELCRGLGWIGKQWLRLSEWEERPVVPQLTLRIWLDAERRRSLTIRVAHFFQGD